jgi:photosystem II stability/assembly factor-like uncharacterized protein
MLKLLCVALIVGGAAATWTDLFKFPFTGAPMEMMMGIACPNSTTCFFSGSHGNDPFGVYYTKDEFKTVSEDVMKGMALMSLAMAFSTETNGVAAGVGALKDSALLYTDDSVNWFSSNDIALSAGQDVEVIEANAYGFIGETNALLNRQGVLYTKDGGKSWRAEDWQKGLKVPDGASPRYGSFPSHTTWYVTGGGWPSSNSQSATSSSGFDVDEDLHHITRIHSFNKRTRKMEFDIPSAGADFNGYSAVLTKTTDGGQTWTLMFNSTNDFYFNDINCWSEEVCIAVGEGFADGASPGGRIYGTTDGGASWKSLFLTTQPNAGMMLVKMVSATEAWVAGSVAPSQLQAQVVFYHTMDGGNSWAVHGDLKGPATVIGWSWIGSTLAYATAVTSVSDCTILKYS